MTQLPVPGETAPWAVHDSFRTGLREDDATRHGGASSSARRMPGLAVSPARSKSAPTKAQQALQLQMRQLELKRLALQVKLKRRHEEQAKEVEKVLVAKQHQLERERQHAFLEARERERGLDLRRGVMPSNFQDSPVESAEELMEDSGASTPRRAEIRVRDNRAIEKERERAAYKALMAEQAELRDSVAREEAARREQAARRIQAFRRASKSQRRRAHAASERLLRAAHDQGPSNGCEAASSKRSVSPPGRKQAKSASHGRIARSESPRLPRQAVPSRNRMPPTGRSSSRSPSAPRAAQGAGAVQPGLRAGRGFSPGRARPPGSVSPAQSPRNRTDTRRARTASRSGLSPPPAASRHIRGPESKPRGASPCNSRSLPRHHSPSPHPEPEGAASSLSPVFLLPDPPSPQTLQEGRPSGLAGQVFRPPWLPPGSPSRSQPSLDLRSQGGPAMVTENVASPRRRSTRERVSQEPEPRSRDLLRTPSMEVTFAAPSATSPRAPGELSTWRVDNQQDCVQNPMSHHLQARAPLPSAEEAELMLQSPLMLGVCQPELPQAVQDHRRQPSPGSRSGGTGMAWWVDFEHLGPQEHWTPDQASVAARTMPSGRPMSGTACQSAPSEPVERRIAEMARQERSRARAVGQATYSPMDELQRMAPDPAGWVEAPSIGQNFAQRLGLLQQGDAMPPVPSRSPSELWELRVRKTNSQLEKLRELPQGRAKDASPGSRVFSFSAAPPHRSKSPPPRSSSPKRSPAFGTSDPVIPSLKIIQKYSDYFISSPSSKMTRVDTEASSPPRRSGATAHSPKSQPKSRVVYPRAREVDEWQAAGFEAASVYKGLRNDAGLRDGWGVLNQKDGSTYAGQWVSGKRHGVGALVFDGGIFEGQWVRGQASGSGLVRFTNGDKFEGQYVGNRKHGLGTYTWADGAVEDGQYFNGLKTDWHTWRSGPSQWKLRYDDGAVVEAQQVRGKEKPNRSAGGYPRAKETRLSPFAKSAAAKPKPSSSRPRKAPAKAQQEEDGSGSPAASLLADLQPQEPGHPAVNPACMDPHGHGASKPVPDSLEELQPNASRVKAARPETFQRMAVAISKVNSLYRRQVALPAEAHESF